jgi:hypothetical protein
MCAQEQYYRTHGQIKWLQYAKCHQYSIIITQILSCKRLSDSHESKIAEGSKSTRKCNLDSARLELLAKEFHFFYSFKGAGFE